MGRTVVMNDCVLKKNDSNFKYDNESYIFITNRFVFIVMFKKVNIIIFKKKSFRMETIFCIIFMVDRMRLILSSIYQH